jgi:hypothetical protein
MSQIYNGTFVLGDTSATTLSAGEGIKLDISVPGVIGISNDETVLWSGNGVGVSTKTQDFILNESYKNFEQLQIWWGNQPGGGLRGTVITNYPVDDTTNAWQGINACSDYPNHISYKMCFLSAVSDTEFTAYSYRQAAVNTNTTANFVWGTPKQYYECYPLKIIGINRISGGN